MNSLYSITIVAHGSRKKYVSELAKLVKPEAIVWDNANQGCFHNHIKAWEWLAGSPTKWGIVLEDDAITVSGFHEQLIRVLQSTPGSVVSLYLGRDRPSHWQPSIAQVIWPDGGLSGCADPNFLVCGYLLHGVGYAVRTKLVADMVKYLKFQLKTFPDLPLDDAVSAWALTRKQRIAYCRPSIVDHRDGPPVIKKRVDGQSRDQQRTAWLFDSREKWSPSIAEIPLPEKLRDIHSIEELLAGYAKGKAG